MRFGLLARFAALALAVLLFAQPAYAAQLTTQDVTITGTAVTPVAATAGGDTLIATARTFLWVKNGGVGAITVTIPKAVNVINVAGAGDIPVSDIVVSVGAGAEKFIAIPPLSHAAGGIASISYSGVTSVTVAAVKLPQI